MTLSAHDEMLALLRGLGLTVHDGAVPAQPAYPYVLVGHRVSRPVDRALARARHGRRVSWLLTLAGLSAESVHVLAEACERLEGARLQGQRVEVETAVADLQTDDQTAPDGAVVHFAKLTASATLPA